MRILLINSEYPPIGGGAGNASANLARTMVQMGHEVTVLTARYKSLPRKEIQSGVQIVRAPALRRKLERSGPLEQALFIIIAFLWSIRTVRAQRPHVVLAFFGVPSGFVALGLNILFGLPYLVSLRGGDVPGFRPYDFALYHRLIGPFLHIVWRKAAIVVANSAGLRSLSLDFDNKVPIRVIPNGVDAARFAPISRDWTPAQLLIVGRVVYQKGIDLLLEALAATTELPWTLSIAGDGPRRESLEKLARELELDGRIRFLGWQSKAELVERYHAANLFVYPSRHEGMPNVVLEAMASGLPVIASEIAGNEELVLSAETGLLVPVEDVDALRSALQELIQDPARRKKMGVAARNRVEEHYTWDNTAEQYLELLHKVSESA